MKRLAAVVLAVAMIVGAVLLRDRIDGDDEAGPQGPGDRFRLVCDTTLGDVCTSLARTDDDFEVVVRNSGATADELDDEGAALDADAWLTTAAWPAIVADNRRFAELDGEVLAPSSEVLARSPVMIATRDDGRAELEAACGGTITWRCVGEQVPAGQRVGLAAPETAAGLTVLASTTDSWFGSDDYSTVDFEDTTFGVWFDDLTGAGSTTELGRQTPLERALTRTGEFTTVGALESETSRLLTPGKAYVPLYAEPMVTADVVLAPRRGLDADRLLDELDRDALRDALASRGWRIDGRAPSGAQDPPGLPDGSNLPTPGVLQSLRDRW